MDKVEKAFKKLASKEREVVRQIFSRLAKGDTGSLNIKKLRGREDIFRVRRGTIRVIYRIGQEDTIFILKIDRRSEDIYKL